MKMPAVMKVITLMAALLTLLFGALGNPAVTITFATTCYHFAMRLVVGTCVDKVMRNRANYHASWFIQRGWEAKLYRLLRVKQWKSHFPTYDPSLFDTKLHTMDEIAQATCQAEIVHEIIVLLSFLPLLATIPFGAFPAFLITSLAATCFDTVFVIMQRFNRPRLIKLIQKGDPV